MIFRFSSMFTRRDQWVSLPNLDIIVILLMVQESGEKTTWNASNPVNKRINTTNLKW